MKLIFLILALTFGLRAEDAAVVKATFSPQGAEALKAATGKVISGEGLIEVTICATGAKKISNGFVYQTAVRNGLATMSPTAAGLVFNRTAARNWAQLAADGTGDASSVGAALGAVKFVKMNGTWIAGLSLVQPVAAIAGGLVQKRLKAAAPDPTPIENKFLDPAASTVFDGPSCVDALMVTRFKADQKQLLGPFVVEDYVK